MLLPPSGQTRHCTPARPKKLQLNLSPSPASRSTQTLEPESAPYQAWQQQTPASQPYSTAYICCTICHFLPLGGHALRAGPAQSLSPLVASPEGEYSGPLPLPGPPLEVLGSHRGGEDHHLPSTSHSSPPLKDKSSLAEFVPMLTQGWAEIFIRRPSGICV